MHVRRKPLQHRQECLNELRINFHLNRLAIMAGKKRRPPIIASLRRGARSRQPIKISVKKTEPLGYTTFQALIKGKFGEKILLDVPTALKKSDLFYRIPIGRNDLDSRLAHTLNEVINPQENKKKQDLEGVSEERGKREELAGHFLRSCYGSLCSKKVDFTNGFRVIKVIIKAGMGYSIYIEDIKHVSSCP